MALLKPDIDRLKKANNTDGLVKALSHRKPEIRLQALNALFPKLKEAGVEAELRKLLDDNNASVRSAAVLRFAQAGDKTLLDEIKKIVVKGTQPEKIEALRTLADWDASDAAMVANIVVLAFNDKKPMIQIEAIRTMGDMKDRTAVYHLAQKLRQGLLTVRIETVRALGKIGTEEAVDLLIGALTDSKGEVRKEARLALESIGSEAAKKALNDAPMMLMIKKMNENVTSKQEVIKHISKNKIKSALPLLRQACGDEYKSVRIEAVKALGMMRDKDSISTIIGLISDPYYDIRLEAVRALGKFIDLRALNTLEKAMDDFNKNVREEAKKAYYNLKARMDNKKI